MSSINAYPTFHYSQPEEYHFSHDSVFLAREIFERHGSQLTEPQIKILDLCAGCGIVGMDLVFHLLKEKAFKGEVDFIEIQNVYRKHFDENKKSLEKYFLDTSLNFNWIETNYRDIKSEKKYDLIVSNPPYFIVGQGALSPNEFKNRCRFFIDSDWKTMIHYMQNSLTSEGYGYFLVREDLKKVIEKDFPEIQFSFKIRNTWVGCIRALNQVCL